MKHLGMAQRLAGLILVAVLAACGSNGPPDGGGGGGSDNIVAAAAGNFHALALADDGTVFAWGNNGAGQLGHNLPINTPKRVLGLEDIVAVAAGQGHSLALDTDGNVYAWGRPSSGQLGRTTGTFSEPVPTLVTLDARVIAIAGSIASSFALDDEGRLWAWGGNASHQLGDGTVGNRAAPQVVPGLPEVASFAVGQRSVFAITEDEGVWAWGDGSGGRLGTGTVVDQPSPIRITALDAYEIVTIAAGDAHTVALLEDGSVIAWGSNFSGQVGQTPGSPATVLVPTPVAGVSGVEFLAAGPGVTAVVVDGSPVTWGSNQHGVLGAGLTVDATGTPSAVDLSGVISLAGGMGGSQSSIYAVHADGNLSAWGWNFYHQLGMGASNIDQNSPVPVVFPD